MRSMLGNMDSSAASPRNFFADLVSLSTNRGRPLTTPAPSIYGLLEVQILMRSAT
jgi:hypothetical protein